MPPWSQPQQSDTCWIGHQAMIVFSSCLCGVTSSLLCSSIPVVSLMVSCGIAVPSLERMSTRYLVSKEFLFVFAAIYLTVFCISSLLLDIHDFGSVACCSVLSSIVVAILRAWFPRSSGAAGDHDKFSKHHVDSV